MLHLTKRYLVLLITVSFTLFFNCAAIAAKSYDAPPIKGISSWINSEPLDIKNLKGKVVLVDFWSYVCPHCLHSLPHVVALNDKYSKQGLVVIGVHVKQARSMQDLKAAIKEHGITYPVAVDNNLATARQYHVHQLPTFFLINKDGKVVYTASGGDNNATLDRKIRELLEENNQKG